MKFEITDQNYSSLLEQGKPIVIDFSAQWCGPCRRMAPIIEELANQYDGQVIIGSCDVDDNQELASQFGVRNIPNIVFLKDGQVKDTIVGAVSKSTVEDKVKALL